MVCVRCCYPSIWNVTCQRDFCFTWTTLSRPDICCCINSQNIINIVLYRSFIVNVGKEFSSPCKLSCGVPQGSILGPLLFLLYVNDMPQAVNSELLLYADDTCLIYMGKNIQKIEKQLSSDFTSLCEWFIDNKLSVHFGEEKTKSILFGTKRQLKDQRDLNLKYGDIEIKQHSRVTYLGCILDNILSGEHMAAKVLNTVNNRLNFSTVNKNFYHFLYDAYYVMPWSSHTLTMPALHGTLCWTNDNQRGYK